MIHLEHNSNIVIRTLENYLYSPDVVKMEARCYNQLRQFMECEGLQIFNLSNAQTWCAEYVAKTKKRPFSYALLRLSDVYEHGRVLSTHLSLHGNLSNEFSDVIDRFIASLDPKEFIESSLIRYREACTMFFRFCQLNDIFCLEKIGFPVLQKYHSFIVESGRYKAHEGCTERMFLFLAERYGLKYGFSLYLHYARNEKCSSIVNFSSNGRKAIERARNIKGDLSSREFCASIPDFINTIKSHAYSDNVIHAHYYFLQVLGLFLECESLDYSRMSADVWADELCAVYFGKSKVKAFHHTLDLFDAFIADRNLLPKSVHAIYKSTYLTLDDWCKSSIDFFLATRKKEGIKETTVKKQSYICARFCRFLITEGLASFKDLRVEHIKAFNIQDNHRSVEGKNLTNQVLYRFLIHMELHGFIKKGLHNALPCCTAHSERIVTILSKEDREKLEVYCGNAVTPIELRDAAILRLGMNTALRGIDIICLEIKNIDWKNRCIKIIQHKTDVEHIHPVDNRTLNSIFRYLKEGRHRDTDSDRIFLSSVAPYEPLKGSGICRNAMQRAQISVSDFHRLRRTYATDSLRGGATFRETAELLGHSDVNTVHKYTLLDDDHMRLCPLSLDETGLEIGRRYRYDRKNL